MRGARRLLHALLRGFSALDLSLRERLTAPGRVAFVAAGCGALAGFDTNQTVTYQAFTFLSALLLVALLASGAWRRGLQIKVTRELPRYATAGEPCLYRVHLENRGQRAVSGATLLEQVHDPRPGFEDWLATREPGEARRNAFDRNMGYFRWRWWIDRRTPERQPETALPTLAPGARTTLRLPLTPRRRGRLALDGVTLARRDPLGLLKGLARIPAPVHLTALPRRYRLPPLTLPGARKYQQGGVSLATSIGDSEEFISLREYRPGDPLQKLAWKSFARTGTPIIKEYQDEFFERHALVLDTCRAAGEDAVFEDAVALAASFVYTIDTQECLLDLLVVAGEVHRYTAGRGQLQASHMLEVLAGVTPSAPEAFSALARTLLAERGRLSSCVLVLLDWDDARRALLATLAASGLQVRGLLVCEAGKTPADLPVGVHALHPGSIEAGLAGLQ
ncbi:MAG: DUF58 domain-containing protein [Proteobacteria bacterium]|nr:DUF58 domain-containing protein [Pseudomonadota bacterium]